MQRAAACIALLLLLMTLPPVAGARLAPIAAKADEPDCLVAFGQYELGLLNAFDRLHDLENRIGRRSAIAHAYIQWARSDGTFDPINTAALQAAANQGYVPMVTWEPWGWDGRVSPPQFPLRDIAAGAFDSYLDASALAFQSVGGPVLVDPMHEMQGEWYPWGNTNGNAPAEYIAAYRHLHDRFRLLGATNVLWVWHPDAEEPDSGRPRVDRYYPGDGYVDWMGVSLYNRGTTESWSSWRDFSNLYQSSYDALRAINPDKPLMLAEWASVEAGGDKAAWVRDAAAAIPSRFPGVKAALWFGEPQPSRFGQMALDSSPEALAAAAAFSLPPYCSTVPGLNPPPAGSQGRPDPRSGAAATIPPSL